MATQAEIPDYSDEVEKPEGGDLAKLAALAQRQRSAEDVVKQCETRLRIAQAALAAIQEKQIPELMEQLGLLDFRTETGLKIKVRKTLRCSTPEENRDACFKFLEDTGNGSVIKRGFTIMFGRDQESWARQFAAQLRRRKRAVNVVETRKVEPSTLNKTLREMLEAGKQVPLEIFKAYWQKSAEVERVE